jgi:succinate-acetate transporter protein
VGFAIFYGGLAQFCAGMWEFRNRNVFGATAFGTYGGFWMGIGLFLVIGNFNLAHGGTPWILHAAGFAGIVTAAVAWYTSAAGVVNGMSPAPVLPVGAAPIGRVGSPMPRRAEV